MSQSTSPTDLARINGMFEAVKGLLGQLYDRWQDEHEYEFISDYGKAIAAKLPDGFKLKRMTKRPFGFEFSIGTDACYSMTATARAIVWKRLKDDGWSERYRAMTAMTFNERGYTIVKWKSDTLVTLCRNDIIVDCKLVGKKWQAVQGTTRKVG
jgi:hypothetical protein